MPNSDSVPREPFLRFRATLAAIRAEQEAHNRLMDNLVLMEGRAIVIERVMELKAREHYEAGGTR